MLNGGVGAGGLGGVGGVFVGVLAVGNVLEGVGSG